MTTGDPYPNNYYHQSRRGLAIGSVELSSVLLVVWMVGGTPMLMSSGKSMMGYSPGYPLKSTGIGTKVSDGISDI